MAEQTSAATVVRAERARVMAVIADFPSYCEWSSAVKEVEVRESHPDGRASQVWFRIDSGPIKDAYTLGYEWDGDREVRWHLVESRMLRSLDGSYTLADRADGDGAATQVTYQLRADVNLPMIGMFRRRVEKVIVDTALTELRRRVETAA